MKEAAHPGFRIVAAAVDKNVVVFDPKVRTLQTKPRRIGHIYKIKICLILCFVFFFHFHFHFQTDNQPTFFNTTTGTLRRDPRVLKRRERYDV